MKIKDLITLYLLGIKKYMKIANDLTIYQRSL